MSLITPPTTLEVPKSYIAHYGRPLDELVVSWSTSILSEAQKSNFGVVEALRMVAQHRQAIMKATGKTFTLLSLHETKEVLHFILFNVCCKYDTGFLGQRETYARRYQGEISEFTESEKAFASEYENWLAHLYAECKVKLEDMEFNYQHTTENVWIKGNHEHQADVVRKMAQQIHGEDKARADALISEFEADRQKRLVRHRQTLQDLRTENTEDGCQYLRSTYGIKL